MDTIEFSDDRRIEFIYDGGGGLLRRLTYIQDTLKVEQRDYVGGMEYTNGSLESIYHAEGRAYHLGHHPDTLYVRDSINGVHQYRAKVIVSDAHLYEIDSTFVTFSVDSSVLFLPEFEIDSSAEFLAEIDTFDGSGWQFEYVIADHLGNTRLVFSDLDEDESIDSSEILQRLHYYPFGLRQKGSWTFEQTSNISYQFNGIEYLDQFGLDVNLADFRALDPAVGRWWSVDPASEVLAGMSPYQAMGNSPTNNVDPNGDFFFVAALGPVLSAIASGAIVGAGINGTISAATGGNFLDGAWKGALTGGLGGGLGAIGGGTFAANLAVGTAEGAITGGVGSVLNGGNFWDGAKLGAITGAVATTATSENLKNALKGEGFKTNSKVFDGMIERGVGNQSIIDYFGMNATFDASMTADAKFWYMTDGSDFGINLGESAFDSYDVLKSSYLKESFHMNRYLAGDLELIPDAYTPQMKMGLEEHAGAKWNYRNQGLYSSSTIDFHGPIRLVESLFLEPYGTPFDRFQKKWWHFIYKIPRRY